MKMRFDPSSILCLSLVLFLTHSSLAKRGGFGRGFSSKKLPSWNRGNTHSSTNTGHKTIPKGVHHRQPVQGHHGGRPSWQQGGHHRHYPVQGNPYRGAYGGYGSHGGYPGGYINQNPNNRILSPHYGGSFGYGGYSARGGSPFSHSVQAMGMYPRDNSRGFGRSAIMAAAGGAVAGMALGYGLGRFPRPHFHFHSRQEEYYYNHYMYRKYGVQSTDDNDYGRDYKYSKPTEPYESFMDSCMKRTGLLSVENQRPYNKAATAAPDSGSITSAAENSSTAVSEQHEASFSSQAVGDDEEDDDDTVSIVEIGYPALMEQLKAGECLELYMAYSEKYLQRQAAGVAGLEMGWRGLLAVVSSVFVMLLNSDVLLH